MVECVPKVKFDCIPLLTHLIKVLVPVFVCYDKLNTVAHVLLENSDKKNILLCFKVEQLEISFLLRASLKNCGK